MHKVKMFREITAEETGTRPEVVNREHTKRSTVRPPKQTAEGSDNSPSKYGRDIERVLREKADLLARLKDA